MTRCAHAKSKVTLTAIGITRARCCSGGSPSGPPEPCDDCCDGDSKDVHKPLSRPLPASRGKGRANTLMGIDTADACEGALASCSAGFISARFVVHDSYQVQPAAPSLRVIACACWIPEKRYVSLSHATTATIGPWSMSYPGLMF
jgi:hypothetical protein